MVPNRNTVFNVCITIFSSTHIKKFKTRCYNDTFYLGQNTINTSNTKLFGNYAFFFHTKCVISAVHFILTSYLNLGLVADILNSIDLDYSSLSPGKRPSLNLTNINNKNSSTEVGKSIMIDNGLHPILKLYDK